MNAFIDLGCYDGDSIRQFYKTHNYEDFDIYGFDPNDRFADKWAKMEKENPRLKFERKAAWIEDGELEYTQRPPEAELGSTVIQTKKDWGMGDIKTVKCFDFSKWLGQLDYEYIIVKIDIEGAEYELLEKIIADGNDKKVNEFWVELHTSRSRVENYEQRGPAIMKHLGDKFKAWA